MKWKMFYFKNNKSNATTSKQKSKVNNNDILVDWNPLKYDVIDFCFLVWSCKLSNFLLTVDNILWLSSSRKEYLLILSSIFNDSVKLSVSSSISSTYSSPSLSSSEISCAMLFSFRTKLMQSSRDFCRQSILCSLIRGSDDGISASKYTYSVVETSRHNFWSASNSKSSSSISIKSSILIIPRLKTILYCRHCYFFRCFLSLSNSCQYVYIFNNLRCERAFINSSKYILNESLSILHLKVLNDPSIKWLESRSWVLR